MIPEDLQVFEIDEPMIGRCSYDKCPYGDSTEDNGMGTVWLEGTPFRFHPDCQRKVYGMDQPIGEEEEANV